jgi:hypothetical protein
MRDQKSKEINIKENKSQNNINNIKQTSNLTQFVTQKEKLLDKKDKLTKSSSLLDSSSSSLSSSSSDDEKSPKIFKRFKENFLDRKNVKKGLKNEQLKKKKSNQILFKNF